MNLNCLESVDDQGPPETLSKRNPKFDDRQLMKIKRKKELQIFI